MPELRNPRWEAFARFTAIGKKRAEAHKLAGYTAKTDKNHANLATRLLTKPEVKARVTEIEEELRTNAVAKAGLDREYVLTELRKNHEKCATPEPVIGRDGEPSGEMKFNAAGSSGLSGETGNPTPGEMQRMLTEGSVVVHYGLEKFVSHVGTKVVARIDLSAVNAVLCLDSARLASDAKRGDRPSCFG